LRGKALNSVISSDFGIEGRILNYINIHAHVHVGHLLLSC